MKYEILTKEYLSNSSKEGKSSFDIAKEINGNPRTIRWYQKKHGIIGMKTKPHFIWNKGKTAKDDKRIRVSCELAHKARKGKLPWNKDKKLSPLTEETRATW